MINLPVSRYWLSSLRLIWANGIWKNNEYFLYLSTQWMCSRKDNVKMMIKDCIFSPKLILFLHTSSLSLSCILKYCLLCLLQVRQYIKWKKNLKNMTSFCIPLVKMKCKALFYFQYWQCHSESTKFFHHEERVQIDLDTVELCLWSV